MAKRAALQIEVIYSHAPVLGPRVPCTNLNLYLIWIRAIYHIYTHHQIDHIVKQFFLNQSPIKVKFGYRLGKRHHYSP